MTPDHDPAAANRNQVFPEGLALGMSAVLGAVIVLAGLLLAVRFTGDDQPSGIDAGAATAATSPSTSSTTPSTATTAHGQGGPEAEPGAETETAPQVEPLACPDGVDEVICDAADFVQQARGRPFQTFPEVQVLAKTEFGAELLAGVDDEYLAQLRREEVVLTALGLLDPEISLVDAYTEALEVGVVGFYDPVDGTLAVRGDDLGLYGQLIMVHELTHAFDDQWFDLERDFDDADAEYAFAAVVEGNARRVEEQWRATLGPGEASQLDQEELAAVPADELQRYLAIPPVLRELLASPYLDGARYVNSLAAGGGEEAVDEALTTPPSSSEQILHPDLRRGADPEVVVDPPPAGDGEAGTEPGDEGRLGELVLDLWLGDLAGDGWGGDRYVTWDDGSGRGCLTVDIVADTSEDLAEIETTAQGWARAQPGDRSVEPVTTGGQPAVRITACP